jgi:broad specificity phosphatase PhoE
MTELVLARHGQSCGNLDHSLGPDTDLTDLGRKQAARLREWLIKQDYDFTMIYCSTLRRARQTAEIVNAHLELGIVFDPDLRESEGDHLSELPLRSHPLDAESQPPFGPQYEAIRERVMRATARILDENPEGRVLVVAHAGTLATMLRSILGAHSVIVGTEQAAVHALRWDGVCWFLQYVNRQEHLVGIGDTV